MGFVRGGQWLVVLFARFVNVVNDVRLALLENHFKEVVRVITCAVGLSLKDLVFADPHEHIAHDTFAAWTIPYLNP